MSVLRYPPVPRLFRGKMLSAAAALLGALFLEPGCAHERTVIRHDSSTISYGLKNDASRHSVRSRHRARREEPSEKKQKILKNPTPGLENPTGKPQNMNMDSLRSILTGAPMKGGSGASGASVPPPPPVPSQGTGNSSAGHAVPQTRDVPLPTR